jgi:hypothetical protein
MEHASNDRERGLIVDAAGQIHRPDEIAPRGTPMLGQAFLPPTYVGRMSGEQVVSLPGGNVISRRRLRALVASGRLKRPANMVNSLRPGRIRRRSRPFGPKLSMEAAALTNPGAYHGLVISPKAALVGRSAAFLGHAVATGRAKIGRDGSVYVRRRSESGVSVFKKVGRIAKKGVRTVGKGAKAAGRGVAKGAKATGKGIAKGAKFVAKGAARIAAMPLILMVRPAIRAKSRQLAGGKGRPVTKVHTLAAKKYVISQIGKRGAPGKVLAGILSFVSGETTHVGGFVMGFDPATITAFISANAVWIVPLVAAMVAAINKMTPSSVSPTPGVPDPGVPSPRQRVAPAEAPGAVPGYVEVPGEESTEEEAPEDAVEGWSFLKFSERLAR